MPEEPNTILLKGAVAPDVVPDPSELVPCEVAIDPHTGKLYSKLVNGTVLLLNPGVAEITPQSIGASPLLHQHMPSDIVGLGISAISGLTAALSAKQDAGDYAAALHTHSSNDIEGLNTALAALVAAINGKQAAGSYAGAVHSHAVSDVNGLQTALDGKAAASHGHAVADVTGLQSALDGKQAAGSYAASLHGHAVADVTGLQSELDGKAAIGHTHAVADVTGLQAALGDKAATIHTHVISEVSGLQSALDAKAPLASVTPSGAVLAFAMATAPTGWLECDGSAVSRATYAALFAAIGTTFGSGNGTTTFNLPDLRGEFIRGWDHGRGIDSGRAFGSSQVATGLGHIGTLGSQLSPNVADYDAVTTYSVSAANGSSASSQLSHYRYRMRPRNLALLFCIKT
jgi:microcystin-dependent protein